MMVEKPIELFRGYVIQVIPMEDIHEWYGDGRWFTTSKDSPKPKIIKWKLGDWVINNSTGVYWQVINVFNPYKPVFSKHENKIVTDALTKFYYGRVNLYDTKEGTLPYRNIGDLVQNEDHDLYAWDHHFWHLIHRSEINWAEAGVPIVNIGEGMVREKGGIDGAENCGGD